MKSHRVALCEFRSVHTFMPCLVPPVSTPYTHTHTGLIPSLHTCVRRQTSRHGAGLLSCFGPERGASLPTTARQCHASPPRWGQRGASGRSPEGGGRVSSRLTGAGTASRRDRHRGLFPATRVGTSQAGCPWGVPGTAEHPSALRGDHRGPPARPRRGAR